MRRLALAFLVLAVAMIALAQAGESHPQAPTWELKDLEGNDHRLEDWRGKWVLLKLGTTMCPSCSDQLVQLDVHKDRIREMGVEILDIYLREDRYSVKKYWKKKKNLSFRPTILYDWKGALVRPYKVSLLPQLVLVDPEGSMVWTAFYTEGADLVAVLEDWVVKGTGGGE